MHPITLRVVSFLILGLIHLLAFAIEDREIFNVASRKRPTVWPPDGVCGQSNRSEFCTNFSASPFNEINCTSRSRCESACRTTFYSDSLVNVLEDSQSSGFSSCVVKNYAFLCPSDHVGTFSVRFQIVPNQMNCSLFVDPSRLGPILSADRWNLTISMWVFSEMQETMVGTLVEITRASNLSGPLLRIFLNSTNIVIQSGINMWTNTLWRLPVYRWKHFAFTVFGDVGSFFVDGQIIGSAEYNLKLLPHDEMADIRFGQSASEENQFTGFLQNVQIFFGALSNREIMNLYNGLSNEGFLVQPNCACPPEYPALASDNSFECWQNPGGPNPNDRVPRINRLSHPIDYVTDDDPETFWVSDIDALSETNSVAIDFEHIYTIRLIDLFFFSPYPLSVDISRRRTPTSPWEPWMTFRRNCSDLTWNIPCVLMNDSDNGHLIFYLNGGSSFNAQDISDFNVASAVNISMHGFSIDQELLRYHALYEVVVNATCYCYGKYYGCDARLQSCMCDLNSVTTGANCEQCLSGFYLNTSASDHVCHECKCDVSGTNYNQGNCDMNDGKCPCKANVVGRLCGSCASGYYNLDAMNPLGCQPCPCQMNNTASCDGITGKCNCTNNVEGLACDRCRPETFWSKTDRGCESCGCVPSGTVNGSLDCDASTGQCRCKAKVTGRNCSRCKLGFYGFNNDPVEGCIACGCSPIGSVEDRPCDEVTGRCNCRPGEGDSDLGGKKCAAYLSSFYPTFGPESGGTTVNIAVGFVGDIGAISVYIGLEACVVDYNSSSAVLATCLTSSIRNSPELLNKSLPLTVRLPDGQALVAGDSFIYKLDPIIEKVSPLRTIESGGINLTVVGSSLLSVAFPRLRIMMTQFHDDGSETVKLFQSPCYHIAKDLSCPTPKLILPKAGRRNQRDLRRVQRELHVSSSNNSDDLRFYIGFVLDGLEKYLNLSNTLPQYGLLDVYSNPVVSMFTEPNYVKSFRSSSTGNESYISIQGDKLNLGAGISDYIVKVGLEMCRILTLTSNQLTCVPPVSQPNPEDQHLSYDGLPAVKVSVGNMQYIPGYLRYVGGGQTIMDDPAVRYGIIGAVIAVVVLIAVAVSCAVVSKLKQSPKHFDRLSIVTAESFRSSNLYPQPKHALRSCNMYLTPAASSIESFLSELSDDLRLKVEDCLMEGQDLKLSRILGQGNFGQVFVGELTGNDNAPLQVAVKTIKGYQMESSLRDVSCFLEEATLMQHLQHEHVLGLIGIVLKPGSTLGIYVVLPLMENGDLRSFILKKDNVLTVKSLVEFGLQVADGMKYLELNKFVHRDLACRNCMVSDSLVVKVADFGLSRDIYEKDYYRASGANQPLPVKWMAIESLEVGVFTTKSDVWSFGVLMWELLTRGCSPYPDVEHMNIKAYLKAGKRLRCPDYAPDELYSIMQKCWLTNPEERPTFESLEHQISHFLKISSRPEDLTQQNMANNNCNEVDNHNTNYVKLTEYMHLHSSENDDNSVVEMGDDHQNTDENSGTAVDQSEQGTGAGLAKFNELDRVTVSNTLPKSKDASLDRNNSSDVNYNLPIENHSLDDVASEFTRL